MKIIRIIVVLSITLTSQVTYAQSYHERKYFDMLKNNLKSLSGFDDKLKQYCNTRQQNLNVFSDSENLIKIDSEEYQLNDIAQFYYEGFQNLPYLDKCKLLYSWNHVSNTIYKISKEKQVPIAISYLPIIYTGLNSYYSAQNYRFGLWGLPYLPAVKYGIIADEYYDQRLDVYLNSNASLSYLDDLHKTFETWDMAITAYCCGTANLIKAGYGILSFDEIYENLKNPNKDCFYRLLAFTKWMNENETLDFSSVVELTISVTDNVLIDSLIDFRQISSVLNIDIDELYKLNPLFTGSIIDGRKKPKMIYLPENQTEQFFLLRDSIANFMDSVYFPKYKSSVSNGNDYETYVHVSISPGGDYEEHKYTIVSGDNLGVIAQRFGVKIADVQDWNDIKGTNIYAGQTISIWLKKGAKLPETEQKQVQSEKKKEETGIQKHFAMRDYDFIETYEVKSGDSLYKISLNYDWASAEDIMEWNGISDPSKLQIGQKLKIFKKKK
ncbi:MAG: LysM peptidoglycan-binding domain-containing protein [Bacteroidales bacterium]|nr:LysM peptidoglycan-binding domain-containing protein [Bacteroidales bacterium]MDD4216218.1 LysM peptidoglycan-binding domain-containing protein [Bacteroidales bacterium]MDY0141376.1 LysM peptidoglycan-binding domain-containing protein [Bacteroidales bacterium]